MDITSTDGAVFVYTFGVMVSALWLSAGDPQITPVVVALFGATSVGWTVYFKWQIAPQYTEDDEEEDEDDLAPPTAGN